MLKISYVALGQSNILPLEKRYSKSNTRSVWNSLYVFLFFLRLRLLIWSVVSQDQALSLSRKRCVTLSITQALRDSERRRGVGALDLLTTVKFYHFYRRVVILGNLR